LGDDDPELEEEEEEEEEDEVNDGKTRDEVASTCEAFDQKIKRTKRRDEARTEDEDDEGEGEGKEVCW
jgi:hypothetical protein